MDITKSQIPLRNLLYILEQRRSAIISIIEKETANLLKTEEQIKTTKEKIEEENVLKIQ